MSSNDFTIADNKNLIKEEVPWISAVANFGFSEESETLIFKNNDEINELADKRKKENENIGKEITFSISTDIDSEEKSLLNIRNGHNFINLTGISKITPENIYFLFKDWEEIHAAINFYKYIFLKKLGMYNNTRPVLLCEDFDKSANEEMLDKKFLWNESNSFDDITYKVLISIRENPDFNKEMEVEDQSSES